MRPFHKSDAALLSTDNHGLFKHLRTTRNQLIQRACQPSNGTHRVLLLQLGQAILLPAPVDLLQRETNDRLLQLLSAILVLGLGLLINSGLLTVTRLRDELDQLIVGHHLPLPKPGQSVLLHRFWSQRTFNARLTGSSTQVKRGALFFSRSAKLLKLLPYTRLKVLVARLLSKRQLRPKFRGLVVQPFGGFPSGQRHASLRYRLRLHRACCLHKLADKFFFTLRALGLRLGFSFSSGTVSGPTLRSGGNA